MLNIVKNYKITFAFSGILVIASLVLLVMFGLNLGIDFKGGSLLQLDFQAPVDPAAVTSVLEQAGFGNVLVQPSEGNQVIIKTQALNQHEDRLKLLNVLKDNFGEFQELRFDSIGPVVGEELKAKARWQTLAVIVGILLYVAYAFRNLGKQEARLKKVNSWRLSIAAIIALTHDIIIVLGVFALLGKLLGVETDIMFVTALLTVLGFSVNDTIVVFDRLRENLQKNRGDSFAEILNRSVNQTLTRSLNTSFTVLFVLLALIFFGGSATFYFVLALIIGITVGTYSSIFIASPLLLLWSREQE